MSTLAGSLSGGATAEIFGGDFVQGAALGAASAAAGYILGRALGEYAKGEQSQNELAAAAGIPGPMGMIARALTVSSIRYVDVLPTGETYNWLDWAQNLALACLEGSLHGGQIVTNEYTFGGSDHIGLTKGAKYVKEYGTVGKLSQISAKISRDATLALVGMKASGVNAKFGWGTKHTSGPWSRITHRGKNVFGADWHQFKLGGKMVHRPHYHYG